MNHSALQRKPAIQPGTKDNRSKESRVLLFDHRSTRPRVKGADGRLSADDAVDIWIARWLRVRPKDLIERYGCDPRRLYEIWAEDKFAGSRDRAMERLRKNHPGLTDRIDFGPHRRISMTVEADLQPDLFPEQGG